MNNVTEINGPIHGYKVFRPDWTCSPCGNTKQYICPGRFEEEGEIEICGNGMHFCQKAADCFNYYDFDSKNKVAEVIAYGTILTDGVKSCTDKLEIVREIPWEEVLSLVNVGKNCTGYQNTGDENAGDRNTGFCNTGDDNTGNNNTGDSNTGSCNTGNFNVGNCNTGSGNAGYSNSGNQNTGYRNIGHRNAGNENSGHRNTGDDNTGDFNTGNRNAGNRNSGDGNIGDGNIGDWNKSSFNVGCFNTKESTITLFNKPSDMTYREWLESEARWLLKQIPKNAVEWVYESDMTDEEKALYPSYEKTGGYLRAPENSDCVQAWWDALSDGEKEVIKAIPNFDPDIFFECTGIKVA